MALRSLTIALAAAAMTTGAVAHAASPLPARASSPANAGEALSGTNDFLPFAIFIAAIIGIVVVLATDDDGVDFPKSP